MSGPRKLSPDDQKRVDEFLTQGVNATPRKPFRPWRLCALLLAVVFGLSAFSIWLVDVAL